jgi:hypothetical protein
VTFWQKDILCSIGRKTSTTSKYITRNIVSIIFYFFNYKAETKDLTAVGLLKARKIRILRSSVSKDLFELPLMAVLADLNKSHECPIAQRSKNIRAL